MPLTPVRTLRIPSRYAMFFDGIDDYVKIEQFTVYGWGEITIQEWIYPFHPKANNAWTKLNMIGDYWVDYPSTFLSTDNRYDYTALYVSWYFRRPTGTRGVYEQNLITYRNTWVNIVRRFNSDREYAVFANSVKLGSFTVSSTEKTVLEWDPATATFPTRYRRFVLGADVNFEAWMKLMQFQLLIYNRALSDGEIAWNFNNPFNPVRDGLRLALVAHPDYIRDIDNDGILEWIDLSGNNNHGKIFGAALVDLFKTPVRTLPAVRTLPVAR
jgi:hypothetical protein